MTYFNFLDFLLECAPVVPLLGTDRKPIPVACPEKVFENGSFMLHREILISLERACDILRMRAGENDLDLTGFSETQIAMTWDGVRTGELDDCELSSLIAGFGLENSVLAMQRDYIYRDDPLRLQFDKVSHPGLALQLGRAIYGENFAMPLDNPFQADA